MKKAKFVGPMIRHLFVRANVVFLSAVSCSRLLTPVIAADKSVMSVVSPDGKIETRLAFNATPEFVIVFNGKKLLRGTLALCVPGTNLCENVSVKSSRLSESDTTFPVAFGKNNPVRDHFKELTLDLEAGAGPVRSFQVVFRAYNDGVAYRYVFPRQSGAQSIEITDEPGAFQFFGDPRLWPLYRENYTTSHEGNYEPAQFLTMATNRLIDLPLLAEFGNGTSISIAQADLRNYAGMYLKAEGAPSQRWLRWDLTPLPGQPGIRVRSSLPLSSPWRVFLVGTSPLRLIESNVILALNEPNAIGDTSWLEAGKSTFHWWSGRQEPFDVKAAVKWNEDYIDFCASNGIRYHAIIGTEGNHPWYHQTEAGYAPPAPDADVTRPRDGFPLEEIVRYAHSKGVGIRFWVHWKALAPHLEEAFTQYEKWGISGLMVDFLDRTDQEMVLFTGKVLESGARHHLNVQFHGVWAPTGVSRTYPNLFNHEGVLNLEYLKWSELCTPQHDVNVAFTRMVAGPMDYHLGGFRASFREGFKPREVLPIVLGTRSQMLAMYVVYENPMPMVADSPSAYVGQPGFDFLCQVPTTWDETRALSGEVGEYIVVARRKGANWWLGAMSNWTPRKLKVPLNFLPAGKYQVKTWTDAPNSFDPNQLVFQTRAMKSSDAFHLNLASGGGAAISIQPVKP